jgi:hypothetical protein
MPSGREEGPNCKRPPPRPEEKEKGIPTPPTSEHRHQGRNHIEKPLRGAGTRPKPGETTSQHQATRSEAGRAAKLSAQPQGLAHPKESKPHPPARAHPTNPPPNIKTQTSEAPREESSKRGEGRERQAPQRQAIQGRSTPQTKREAGESVRFNTNHSYAFRMLKSSFSKSKSKLNLV